LKAKSLDRALAYLISVGIAAFGVWIIFDAIKSESRFVWKLLGGCPGPELKIARPRKAFHQTYDRDICVRSRREVPAVRDGKGLIGWFFNIAG
jgi:hypothetical protein